MSSFISRYWKILVPVGGVIGLGVLYLAFAVFEIQTAFTDKRVDEASPFADVVVVDDDDGDGDGEMVDDGGQADDPAELDVVDEAEEPPSSEPEIATVVAGSFVGRSHPSSGTVTVITDGSEQRFLRFEDFETDNGPDLFVYLSTAPVDADASAFDDDFVDLGTLKGNIGNQNYEIPADVDLDRYTTVVIWCRRFAVAFGAAELI